MEKEQACTVLNLDLEACEKELKNSKDKITKQRQALARFKIEYISLQEKRDELQLKLSRTSHESDSTAPPEKPEVTDRKTTALGTAFIETAGSHCQKDTECKKTITAHEGRLTEMEDVQSSTLNEVENVRLSPALIEKNTSNKIHGLEAQLAEERVRSGRLE